MTQDVFDLLRRLGRRLGEMPANPLGLGADRHGRGQMIERSLPDELDQIFGGIEFRRMDGSMEEVHGHAFGQGHLRQQFG